MFECEICNRKLDNIGNANRHIKKCKELSLIKEDVIRLYINEAYSVKDLRRKFKVQCIDIKNILGDKVRSLSDANKLAHKKYPENFRHSEESKKKLREKRLLFMKNNPEKTAWRLSNISYPEKLCIMYIENNELDKKYSIVREYSVFPYFIDFAFINEMVAVEIDGSQHLLPDRKEKDNKKDKQLNELGWVVIRVSEKEIKTNINEVFKQIVSLLINKPKVNNHRVGLIVKPKKYQKKERNEFGFTEKQIQSINNQRRVNRPSFCELKTLIDNHGYVGTGRIFGVSDNAIRKWLISYNKGL